MTVKRKNIVNRKIVIDLDGPDGNAFYLIGQARRIMRDLDFPMEKTDRIVSKMLNGDYINLLKTFESHFGEYFELNTEKAYILGAFEK